VVKLLKCRVQ